MISESPAKQTEVATNGCEHQGTSARARHRPKADAGIGSARRRRIRSGVDRRKLAVRRLASDHTVRSHHLRYDLNCCGFDEDRASARGGYPLAEGGADIRIRRSGFLDRRSRICDMRRDRLRGVDTRSYRGSQRKLDRSPKGMGSQDHPRRGTARSAWRASSFEHYTSRN